MHAMTARVPLVAALLFGSGTCALIYQVIWFRELRLVFGSSTAANAATLAIFMGGLGAGSAVLGRYANRHPKPLLLYGNLEIAIALAAAISPFLIQVARSAYIGIGGYAVLGQFGATVARLVLSLLTLGAATFLMGGTMPAAAKAVETNDDLGRRKLAFVYGLNTVGAVTGVTLATFVLLESFGNRMTLLLAVLANLLIGIIARSKGREGGSETDRERPSRKTPSEGVPIEPAAPYRLVLGSAAIVGFLFMMMELVWYRMLSPLLGGSTFTFGLILAWALLGIGLGGVLYSSFGVDRPATLTLFAWTCGLEALCFAVPLALGDKIALVAQQTRPLGATGFSWFLVAWSLVCVVVVLPAATVAGFQFPLLAALMGRGREKVASQLGSVYAWNTLGSIGGSLAGGFFLLSALSAPGTWRLGIGLAAVLALAVCLFDVRNGGTRRRTSLLSATPALLAVALMAFPGPSALWRHTAIGAGRAKLFKDRNQLIRDSNAAQRGLVWEADGKESGVALAGGAGLAFVVNGKIDGHAIGDAGTQVMLGLTGAMLHPNPKRALVVGLGTGSSAGWLADVAEIEQVDVVELEPKIVTVAEHCAPVNRGVLENPKAELVFADAREVLQTTRQQYQLIASEPSNPYRAGISSLFSTEFYEAVATRLDDDGLFLQWLQAYEVDGQTIGTVIATLQDVFEDVEIWHTLSADLLLVASETPIVHDVDLIRRRVNSEPFRSALAAAWGTDSLEGVLAHYLASPQVSKAAAEADRFELNSDDRNLVEFGFARSLGRTDLFDIKMIRRVAESLGATRPTMSENWHGVDWGKVELERLLAFEAVNESLLAPAQVAELRSVSRTKDLVNRARTAEAVALWRSLGREATTMGERTRVGWALANEGDEEALVYADQLASQFPLEKHLLVARLRLSQGDLAAALADLRKASRKMKLDAWGSPLMRSQLIPMAVEIAQKQPELAPEILSLLEDGPYAVHYMEELRLTARLDIAWQIAPERFANVLAEIEPHVPWDAKTLFRRADAYRAIGHPLADQADIDFGTYLETSSVPFDLGLVGDSLENIAQPDQPLLSGTERQAPTSRSQP